MIEKWLSEKHIHTVDEWLLRRGIQATVDPKTLPSTGFMADECVVGFLYLTNSSTAFLDSFVSDPAVSQERRMAAKLELMEGLLKLAKDHRVTRVCAATFIRSLVELGHLFEFHEIDGKFHYLTRSL